MLQQPNIHCWDMQVRKQTAKGHSCEYSGSAGAHAVGPFTLASMELRRTNKVQAQP